jgi:hypothetical protein
MLLSWHGLRRGFSPAVVALCAALAYHAHPSSIVFAGGAALFYLAKAWSRELRWRSLVLFGLTFTLLLLPWILWTKFYLQLPSTLISQNLFHPHGAADWLNLVWVRFKNLFDLLTPGMFGTYPFDLSRITKQATFSLPGAVGLLFIIPAFLQLSRLRDERAFLWLAFILPALGIVFVFSILTITAAHMPAVVGALVFFGAIGLRNSIRSFWLVCTLQLFCNFVVWKMYCTLWQASML